MENRNESLSWILSHPPIKKLSYINFILHIVCGFLSWFYAADVGINTYVSIALVSFVLNELLIIYGCFQGADKVTLFGIIGINIMGVLVQSVFGIPEIDGKIKQLVIYLVAIVAMVGFAIVTRKFKMKNFWITVFSGFLSVLILLVCCVMPENNGARNWISIAGFSIQLTEIVKFFGIIFLGSLYLNKWNEIVKFVVATCYVGLSAVLLVVRVNEMGTLLVLGLVYISLFYMYIKTKWLKWTVSALIVMALGVLIWGYNHIDSLSYRWECPAGCTETVTDESGAEIEVKKILHDTMICDDCKVGKLRKEPAYICDVCKFRRFSSVPEEEEYKCEVCSEDFLLGGPLGSKLSKLYNRFSVWLNYDIMRYEDSAFQTKNSETSAVLGGWFGSRKYDVYIPNMRNDSVIAGAMGYMGFASVAVILLLFYLVFLGIRNSRSPLKTSAILAFSYQAMIAVMGNLNMFALTGIGVPMVSTGGSIYIVSLLLIYIILTADNRIPGGEEK